MTCKECKPVGWVIDLNENTLTETQPNYGFSFEHTSLCPKHALTERLVEALRDTTLDGSKARIERLRKEHLDLLKEYDQLEGRSAE